MATIGQYAQSKVSVEGEDWSRRSPAFATRAVLLVVVAKSALNFAVADRYGWQRDELYYAVAGRHLQGGYVDFPPLTALVSALARVLFGSSLVGNRKVKQRGERAFHHCSLCQWP